MFARGKGILVPLAILSMILISTGCKKSGTSASPQLLALFPERQGVVSRYFGLAEYGHEQELKSIKREPETVTQGIEGLVDDMSDGASSRDFSFAVELIFDRQEVRERILHADTPFPHWLDGLVLIRLPLKAGATWTQKLKVQGDEKTVTSEIIKAERLGGNVRQYTVRYRFPLAGMPGGVYEEIRAFREGTGLVGFEKTFGPKPQDRFTYSFSSMKFGDEASGTDASGGG